MAANFGGNATLTTPVGEHPAGATDAGCQDMLGNVWEWTTSWFEGYPGFRAFPYRGYSEVYFDRQHRVLRGGSWATLPWAMRGTLRNWYYPHIREIFAGFRCVCDGSDIDPNDITPEID
jgi:formylglycine-generating enzyme required for sulfatase activity